MSYCIALLWSGKQLFGVKQWFSTFLMLQPLVQFLMWPPIIYFHCYFINVILLMLWIVIEPVRTCCFPMVFGNPCERVLWPQRDHVSHFENHWGKGWQLVSCSRMHVLTNSSKEQQSSPVHSLGLCVLCVSFLLLQPQTHSRFTSSCSPLHIRKSIVTHTAGVDDPSFPYLEYLLLNR